MASGSAECLSVWEECQQWIELLASSPVPITELLTKVGDRRAISRPRERIAAPIFPPLLPGWVPVPESWSCFYFHCSRFVFLLYFLGLAKMPSKVDMAVRRALEAAIAAWQAEKNKKRPVAKAGPYELKRIRRGPA